MSKQRLNYYRYLSKEAEKLSAIEQHLVQGVLDARLLELVKLRVSQINGCSFCVAYHTRLLRLMEETTERLDQVVVWEEAPCFDEREVAAFRWAEAVTRIAETRYVNDELYSATLAVFGEEALCQLTMAIGTINTWNRLAIAFHADHGTIEQLVNAKQSQVNS